MTRALRIEFLNKDTIDIWGGTISCYKTLSYALKKCLFSLVLAYQILSTQRHFNYQNFFQILSKGDHLWLRTIKRI